jgi:hypothetical protein
MPQRLRLSLDADWVLELTWYCEARESPVLEVVLLSPDGRSWCTQLELTGANAPHRPEVEIDPVRTLQPNPDTQ